MEVVKNKIGNVAKIFAKTIEPGVYDQIKQLINYEPYLNSKVRLMPDCHQGKGCTIGTAMTITDKVTPNLVGSDIGCSVHVFKLDDNSIDLNKLDGIIRDYIPYGRNIHNKVSVDFDFGRLSCNKSINVERASKSIGTLGGNNHFIEVNSNDIGELYLTIHTGSRNLGVQVCKYYQDLAIFKLGNNASVVNELISKLKSEGRQSEINNEISKLEKKPFIKELAYLEGGDFVNYINDVKITQEFAYLNGQTIGQTICEKMNLNVIDSFTSIHNYIDVDNMILRKGAVRANAGERLIIPINMRDGSLICVGKGNEDWNYSAPHGAGRLMSRSKAKENIKMEDYVNSMIDVYTTSVSESTLDEAPQAYKPMDEIIDAIKDTVEIQQIIKPIYNFKA